MTPRSPLWGRRPGARATAADRYVGLRVAVHWSPLRDSDALSVTRGRLIATAREPSSSGRWFLVLDHELGVRPSAIPLAAVHHVELEPERSQP